MELHEKKKTLITSFHHQHHTVEWLSSLPPLFDDLEIFIFGRKHCCRLTLHETSSTDTPAAIVEIELLILSRLQSSNQSIVCAAAESMELEHN